MVHSSAATATKPQRIRDSSSTFRSDLGKKAEEGGLGFERVVCGRLFPNESPSIRRRLDLLAARLDGGLTIYQVSNIVNDLSYLHSYGVIDGGPEGFVKFRAPP